MANLDTRLTLIARVRDPADDRAWTEFVTLYTPIIFGFLRKRGLAQADAEDVTQDSFRALAKALPSFQLDKAVGTFRNWLFTVTRSKLNTHFRRSKRVPVPMGDDLPEVSETKDWDELYMKELFKKACVRVETQVDPSTWEAFWRTAVQDENAEEVAAAMGLKVGNVYQKRSRVAGRIRAAIAELDDTALAKP